MPISQVNQLVGNPHEHWWKKGSKRAHTQVFSTVEHLDQVQQARRDGYLRALRQYTNRQATDFSGSGFAASQNTQAKIRLNATKSCIDTATAHMGTARPRPMYLTVDGNYQEKQRAKGLGKFMLGQFLAMQRYTKGLQIFRDGAMFGPGIEKFYEHPASPGTICSERVFPDELVYDEDEAAFAMPRTLYQVKQISKPLLAELYPKNKSEIMQSAVIRELTDYHAGVADMCSVVESWHLPSGPKAKDGRHVICVSGATLVDAKWERERFPFAVFNWSDPVIGWFGIGGCEEIAPLQLEINYIAQKIQRLMTLATSFVWKEKGSGVGRIMNKDFSQYEYSGRPPIFQTVSSVSGEYFQHLDRLYNRVFEIFGVSQMSAMAKRPEGLDSGEALRTFADIGSKRWRHVGRRWQQFHLDAAECIYDVASDIKANGDAKSMKVLYAGDDEVSEVNFNDVYLDRHRYVIQPFPVSLLPDTPEGKIELITRMAQTMPQMAPHLPALLGGYPDFDAVTSRMMAPMKLAEKMVHGVLQDGRFEAPYPTMDLGLTRMVAETELLKAYADGVPDDRTHLLRRFIAQIDRLQEKEEQASMPPPPPAGVSQSPAGGQATLTGPPPSPEMMPPVPTAA